MLGSLHEIVRGLDAGDLASIESAARRSGLATAADVDPELEGVVPEPFRELGVSTHRAFDALAERALAGASTAELLQELSAITSQCVACHEAYRIDNPPR